jgi:hypothetical protein
MASRRPVFSLPQHENIFLWKPEFSTQRTVAYSAQDTPVFPPGSVESVDEMVEVILVFNKPRLEPARYTYASLEGFLKQAPGGCRPSPLALQLSDLRKIILVDDRRRSGDPTVDAKGGLDGRHQWFDVREFWTYMERKVSYPIHVHTMENTFKACTRSNNDAATLCAGKLSAR